MVKVVHSKGDKGFQRLLALGEEKVQAIDKMLLEGGVPRLIAIMIQKDWGDLIDIQVASIKKMLERYRATRLPNKIIESVVSNTTLKAGALTKRLNALDEFERLVQIQKTRFDKVYAQEAKSPLLMKSVSDEARLLKESLTELGRLQLETGFLQRVQKKVSGTITDATGKRQKFEWTEEQAQMYKQIELYDDEIIHEA